MDVTTTLKIKADTKEAQKAGQVVKQAFSPVVLTQFNAATKALSKQIGTLAQQMAALNKLMLTGAQQATAAYKNLAVAVKSVGGGGHGMTGGSFGGRGFAPGTPGAMGGPAGTAAQAVAATHQNRNSFIAGLAQGLGVAEYIPTEPGMGYRIGGAMVGRGMRAAAAPFLTPGVGGVAQMLSSIPAVGGIAGVGLQAAAGAVQTRIGYERLVHQGLFAGAQQWRGTMRAPTGDEDRELLAAQEGATKARNDWRAVPLTDAQMAAMAERAVGPGYGPKWNIHQLTPAAIKAEQDLAEETDRARRDVMSAEDVGDDLRGAWLIGRPMPPTLRPGDKIRVKQMEAERADIAAQERLDKAQQRHMINTGSELGLSPTEVVQMRNQFMQARGGQFENAGASGAQFQQAMVGQIFGVNAGVAGAFARGGTPGGGGGRQSLMDTMASAIVAGMDSSILAEYMDTLVGLQQQAEQRGLKIDPAEFNQLSFGLKAAGIEPLQNKRLTAEFAAAPMNVARRGIETPADMMMIRAVGEQLNIDTSTTEGFFTAKRAMLEQPMLAAKATLAASVKNTRGYAGNTREEMIRSFWQSKGVEIAPTDVDALITAGEKSPEELDAEVARLQKKAKEKSAKLPQEARDLVSKGAPTLRTVADLERMKIDLGKTAADAILGMERNSTRAGVAMGDFSEELKKLNEAVGDVIGWLRKHLGGGKTPGRPTATTNK